MSELAYEHIKVGDEASLARTITEAHIVNFTGITGDMKVSDGSTTGLPCSAGIRA
jgi:acyl dehydratase